MRVYLSLPISMPEDIRQAIAKAHGDNAKEAEKAWILNRRSIAAMASGFLQAKHEDWTIVNPFHIADMLASSNPKYCDLIGADIATLMECDGAIFLNEWEKSKGCALENFACRNYGISLIQDKELLGVIKATEAEQKVKFINKFLSL